VFSRCKERRSCFCLQSGQGANKRGLSLCKCGPSKLNPSCFLSIFLLRGLGTGIAASALIKHRFSTTVIEIDPAIYDVAKEYFGLPSLDSVDDGDHHIFLEDARAWIRKRRLLVKDTPDDAATERGAKASLLFDVVIHDCFTGGGVPEHLFTVEFWNDLKAILTPHGVVAVVSSFSTRFLSVLTRLINLQLHAHF
jgi:spermidine synthase